MKNMKRRSMRNFQFLGWQKFDTVKTLKAHKNDLHISTLVVNNKYPGRYNQVNIIYIIGSNG